jgi:hypothetical protein
MSGAEAAGLILAVLPLVMHTVDSYVQGVQTLKRFHTRRYREELEDYKLRIDTQRTEFLNTLELLFDGIVDREDELRDLITNPKGQLWTESTIEAKLRKRLAHSYEVYIQTMWKLYSLLQQINETLGAGAESVEKVFPISFHEVSSIVRVLLDTCLFFFGNWPSPLSYCLIVASTILISHVILIVFSIQYYNVIFWPPIIN